MDNMAMLNLQMAAVTAAGTAGAGASNAAAELTGVPEDGASFSDVLAQATGGTEQAGGAVLADQSAQAVENAEVPEDAALTGSVPEVIGEESGEEEVQIPDFKFEAADIEKLIGQAQDGVKKGMRMLLKAVLKAFTGSNDGKAKKTDLFSVFGGGSDLFDKDSFGAFGILDVFGSFEEFDGVSEDMLFLGSEILSKISAAAEFGLESEDTEADDIIAGLDRLVKKIFTGVEDDEDIDENTAAEIVAGLLNIPMAGSKEFVFADEEEKTEAIRNAADVLAAPKEAVAENMPEKAEQVDKAERRYDELKAEVKYTPAPKAEENIGDMLNNVRSVMQMKSFSAKVNDAGAQIRAISGEAEIGTDTDTDTDTIIDTDTSENAAFIAENGTDTVTAAFAAAANTEPQAVQLENTAEIAADTDVPAADSVERQVTDVITERAFEIKEDNGTEELIMVLKPENLGQVAVKLVKENGAVSVMLSAQYEEVGKMMTERAAALGGSLSENNVEVKNVEVVDPSSAAEQMGLAFTNQGFSFAGSFNRGRDSAPERRGGYGSAEEVEGIDIVNAADNIELIREARLWTTA